VSKGDNWRSHRSMILHERSMKMGKRIAKHSATKRKPVAPTSGGFKDQMCADCANPN